jgi:hypothetical protein
MIRSAMFFSTACVLILIVSGCNNAPGYPKPSAEVLRPQDQLNFNTLYNQNCAACHGADGQNGAATDLANPEYQSIVDDQSLDQRRDARDANARLRNFRRWHSDRAAD